jgi:hypothetical protein
MELMLRLKEISLFRCDETKTGGCENQALVRLQSTGAAFFCNFILDVSSKKPETKTIAPIKAVRKTFARVSESVFG